MIPVMSLLPMLKSKGAIIGIIAVIVISVFVMKELQVRSLRSDIKDLTATNTVLSSNNEILKLNIVTMKENMNSVIASNNKNLATIRALVSERAQAKRAIDDLIKANNKSQKEMLDLNKHIDEMMKDPSNDGPLAPVLRETIRRIQPGESK